jgi:hypothetical protein
MTLDVVLISMVLAIVHVSVPMFEANAGDVDHILSIKSGIPVSVKYGYWSYCVGKPSSTAITFVDPSCLGACHSFPQGASFANVTGSFPNRLNRNDPDLRVSVMVRIASSAPLSSFVLGGLAVVGITCMAAEVVLMALLVAGAYFSKAWIRALTNVRVMMPLCSVIAAGTYMVPVILSMATFGDGVMAVFDDPVDPRAPGREITYVPVVSMSGASLMTGAISLLGAAITCLSWIVIAACVRE